MTVSSGSGVTMLPGGGGGAASGITIGTSVITGGTDTRVLFDDNGFVGEDAGFTYNKTTDIASLTGGLVIGSAGSLAWSTDLFLVRDAANTLAQRNGTTGQIFNLYGTFTDASNYARVQLSYNLGQQRAYLDSQVAGTSTYGELYLRAVTGTLYIDGNSFIQFVVTTVNKIYMDSNGMLGWNTDNTGDIGASGATRPRSAYIGTNITAGAFIKSTSATAGIGYATGAGGTVSQATDRTTGVTLNTITGQITTQATSLAALATVTFTVTNSAVAATDTIILSMVSGDIDTIARVTAVAAGSFNISLYNSHPINADTTAMVINFSVIKGVTS